jgi:hypothetical protein
MLGVTLGLFGMSSTIITIQLYVFFTKIKTVNLHLEGPQTTLNGNLQTPNIILPLFFTDNVLLPIEVSQYQPSQNLV